MWDTQTVASWARLLVVWDALSFGRREQRGESPADSKQKVHWLEGGERFLADDLCWRGKLLSPGNQAFTGNQSLSASVLFA